MPGGAIHNRLRALSGRVDHAIYVCTRPRAAIVGWVHILLVHPLVSEPRAEIGGLVVRGDHRRQGVGKRLLAEAERWACRQKCGTVQVRTKGVRHEARNFYEEIGYRQVKTQNVFRKKMPGKS